MEVELSSSALALLGYAAWTLALLGGIAVQVRFGFFLAQFPIQVWWAVGLLQ